MSDREEMLGNLPLQYFDGPDYCTVKDATGGDFALTVQPELMKMMEDALSAQSEPGYVAVPTVPTKEMLEAGVDNNPTSWNDNTDPQFMIDVANDVYVAMVKATLPAPATASAGWQPIETAPKDGTAIIGAFWSIRWADSHRKGDIVSCWYQPEFEAFISSCREMTLAPGLTFENGSSRELHSPVIEPVTHWMPLPAAPTKRSAT